MQSRRKLLETFLIFLSIKYTNTYKYLMIIMFNNQLRMFQILHSFLLLLMILILFHHISFLYSLHRIIIMQLSFHQMFIMINLQHSIHSNHQIIHHESYLLTYLLINHYLTYDLYNTIRYIRRILLHQYLVSIYFRINTYQIHLFTLNLLQMVILINS